MANVTVDALNVRPMQGAIPAKAEMAAATTLGTVVRLGADGKAYLASAASAAGASGQLAIIVAGSRHYANPTGEVAAGEVVTLIPFGEMYLGTDAALDPTKPYYLGVDGAISDAPGTVARFLGYPTSSTKLFFNPTATLPSS